MATPQVVCVLGMHRSGTSVITRMLNLLGVSLGSPEQMMAPQPDNPFGFWEHRALAGINVEILSRLGGSWDQPPRFPDGWQTAAELADLRRQAQAIVEEEFAGAPIWGWKDPRTCLTLPFWQELLPSMRYVLCLRNPVDVARSLERRNGFTFDDGVALWTAHTQAAVLHTAGRHRLLVSYEEVMDHGLRELRRLAAHVGAAPAAERADVQAAVRDAIKAEARHHRTSIVDTAAEPLLAFRAKALYLVLRLCEGRDDAASASSGLDVLEQSLPAVLDRFSASLMAAPGDAAEQIEERDRAIEALRQHARQREIAMLTERAGRAEDPSRPRPEVLGADRLPRALARRVGSLPGRVLAAWGSARRGLGWIDEAWRRAGWETLPLRAPGPGAGDAAFDDSQVTFRFTTPPRAVFESRISLGPEVWTAAPAGMELSVSVAGAGRRIERRWRIDPASASSPRRPITCRLDLRRLANQPVQLTCRVSAPGGAAPGLVRTMWARPVIRSRKPAREIGALAAGYVQLYGLRGTLRRAMISAASSAGARAPAPPAAVLAGRADASPRLARASGGAGVAAFLADPHALMVFPAVADPLVSIVIPTYNGAGCLYECLRSVLAHTDVPFETIVVDDASADATPELVRRLRHVKHARNESNLDFIRTCNAGARLASGRHLLFLNNDVVVTPGWLNRLVATIETYPDCGAVHGKLVHPDGRLQEAGSIVWRDGSVLGYGRGDDPARPEYGYRRETDFGSAACLLIRADLFRGLGGFDERYLPAYYEDADLCFGVRRAGYKVVFEPRVSVLHAEFGSGSAGRAERLCTANQPKFAEKWAVELGTHRPSGDALRGRDRRPGRRLLMLDDQVPAPHLGSGSPRTYRMLELLAELGLIVTFAPVTVRTAHQPATDRLQQLGIEIFHGDGWSARDLMRSRAGLYDVVIVSRPHVAAKLLDPARQHFPAARLVYDAEALFCVRDFRRAEIEGRPLSERRREQMLRRELDVMKGADVVLTASALERDMILEHGGHHDVVAWGHAVEVAAAQTPFSARRDLLFVGGFLDGHPPNTDAVVHFATALLPRIRQRLPGCRLVVVGADPPAAVRALASDHVVVAGYAPDLCPHYEARRVFVVPHRFGAGISLKLLEAMAHGIPAVASATGASGLGLAPGREALIARTDDEFVDHVVRLHEDEALWRDVQRAAQEHVRRHCSAEALRRQLGDALCEPS